MTGGLVDYCYSNILIDRVGVSSVNGISDIINQRQLISTGINKLLNTTDISCYENDRLFSELGDLVNVQFKAWYCKQFYRLGKDRVFILASQARVDGRDSRRLFSSLLKKAQ